MAAIGSWWVKGFDSRPDEEVLDAFYANYLRGEARPLGGKLYVTAERILFCPHLIDAYLGGSRRMIDREEIDRVERTTEGGSDRLVVHLADEPVRFVINDIEAAMDTIDTEPSAS